MERKLSIKSKNTISLFLSMFALLTTGVSSQAEQPSLLKSFDKSDWKHYSDRGAMAQDLVKSKRLKTMTKAEVHDLLGLPFWDYQQYELYALKLVPSDFHHPNPVVPALKIEYVSGSKNLITLSTCTVPASLNYPDFPQKE